MKSLNARASIKEDNAFCEKVRDSSAKTAPSGTWERSSSTASDRRLASTNARERAHRVIVPDRHAEPATKAGGEEGRGEVGVGGAREGREPCASTGVAVES